MKTFHERSTVEQNAHWQFEALYAEWLDTRAKMITENPMSDAVANGRCRREEELARLITTTPCVLPWQIWHKIEVLEYCLSGVEGGTSWSDNREFVMLAGIKADLRRFEPSDREKEEAL